MSPASPEAAIYTLYSTFPTKYQALAAARALLDKRLVACANIVDNVTSLYHWQGELQQEPEVLLLAKTGKDRLAEAIKALKNVHPYELPCILAYAAADGLLPFIQWVEEETGGNH